MSRRRSTLAIAALATALAGVSAAAPAVAADTPTAAENAASANADAKKRATNPCGPSNHCSPRKKRKTENN